MDAEDQPASPDPGTEDNMERNDGVNLQGNSGEANSPESDLGPSPHSPNDLQSDSPEDENSPQIPADLDPDSTNDPSPESPDHPDPDSVSNDPSPQSPDHPDPDSVSNDPSPQSPYLPDPDSVSNDPSPQSPSGPESPGKDPSPDCPADLGLESSDSSPQSPNDLHPSPQSPCDPDPGSADRDPNSPSNPASPYNEDIAVNNSDPDDDLNLTSGDATGEGQRSQLERKESAETEEISKPQGEIRDAEYGSDSEKGGDSVSNFSGKDQSEASYNVEKFSGKDSDSESINSSVVSQRNTETLTDNSGRGGNLGNNIDWAGEGDSVKTEEEGGVVVGLEALDSLAHENGRCGSPSIVSEATDTVAGSLVVETGSLGGESSTVRSMPRSEASDYDYQDVENGEEDEEYPNEVHGQIIDSISAAEERQEDSKPPSPAQSASPQSASPPQSDSRQGNGQTVSAEWVSGLHTENLDDKQQEYWEGAESINSPDSAKDDDAGLYPGDSLTGGSDGKDDDRDSQEPAPEDDFDYDDLDLEPVSETVPDKHKGRNYSATSEPADSSGVTGLLDDYDVNQQQKLKKRDILKRVTDSDLVTSTDSISESRDSISSESKSVRSSKTNLAEDHVELDYDEEEIGPDIEEKGRHVELVDEELENGEIPDEEEQDGADEKSDEGEVDDDDDCEEGEIREPGNRKPFVKPICRFYLNGKCTWGTNCRFLHPGVNDKGNYRLIERPDFNNTGPGMGMRGPFGPGPWGSGEMGPDPEFIPPVTDPVPSESAWERGLRHAKELMKKASQRKETDPGFEEKRLNLSLEEEREFNKENDQRRLGGKDPYIDAMFEDDIYDKPSTAWQQGQYENFEVRWNREPDYPYRSQGKDRGVHIRDRRVSPPSPRMGSGPPPFMGNPNQGPPMHPAERYNKRNRDGQRDKWRGGEEEGFNSGGPRIRADTWHDPWRRSKSPKRKPRDSPSRSRSRGRRRYRRSYSYSSSYSSSSFSGSSRSRSRSSYSSLSSRSSLSRTSSFSSRSRSRSMQRKRPPQDPQNAGPLPMGPGTGQGAMPEGLAPGAGPTGDRKVGPTSKSGEPRSAVSVKPRHSRPSQDKRRPVIGPMPRPPPKEKPLINMPEGRGRGMRDQEREDRGRGRGRGRGRAKEGPIPGRPPAKKRGASNSSSGSSRSRSRSRSSSSSSKSRSVSSVSSHSSTSSSSSSGSADSEHLYRDIAEPNAPETDKPSQIPRRKKVPPGLGGDLGPGAEPPPGPPRDRDRSRRGSQKDRPPRDKRPRRSSPSGLPPGGRDMPRTNRPDGRRGQTEPSGKPQVSSTTPVKSKDPMKMVGQKSNIKLTLISKPSEKNGVSSKKRPADGASSSGPPAKKAPVSPTKAPTDKGGKPVVKVDKPVTVTNPRMKPPQAIPRANPPTATAKPTISPTKAVSKSGAGSAASVAAAAAAAAAKQPKKSTSSRREELLKQLKAVEDAIARKRSKLP